MHLRQLTLVSGGVEQGFREQEERGRALRGTEGDTGAEGAPGRGNKCRTMLGVSEEQQGLGLARASEQGQGARLGRGMGEWWEGSGPPRACGPGRGGWVSF